MNERKAISKLLVILFFATAISTGMYTSKREMDSCLSYSDIVEVMTAKARNDKKYDMEDVNFASSENKVKSNLVNSLKRTGVIRIYSENPFNDSGRFSALFIALVVLITSQLFIFIYRRYLILFIHNTDGKKRK